MTHGDITPRAIEIVDNDIHLNGPRWVNGHLKIAIFTEPSYSRLGSAYVSMVTSEQPTTPSREQTVTGLQRLCTVSSHYGHFWRILEYFSRHQKGQANSNKGRRLLRWLRHLRVNGPREIIYWMRRRKKIPKRKDTFI